MTLKEFTNELSQWDDRACFSFTGLIELASHLDASHTAIDARELMIAIWDETQSEIYEEESDEEFERARTEFIQSLS